jgi:hydroxymethylpyrimidine pyrophosphatase-like HAD family hydrolase
MEWRALASDYDGTLAHDAVADPANVRALEEWRASGRKLILATGRQTHDLLSAFPSAGFADLIVSEDGAVLYEPATGREELLVEPPSEEFWRRLKDLRVRPLDRGRVVVASERSQAHLVAQAIRETGAEVRVSLNRGSLMVLPRAVGKARGVAAAAARLGIGLEFVAAVGDAENDLEMLEACGLGAAVADAVPEVRARARVVVESVSALIAAILAGRL